MITKRVTLTEDSKDLVVTAGETIEVVDSAGRDLFACVDDYSRDLIFTSVGSSTFVLPLLSTLMGQKLPVETVVESGENLLIDLGSAQISEIFNSQLVDENVAERESVFVCVDGEDYPRSRWTIEVESNPDRCVLNFFDGWIPVAGSEVRVKWRSAPWSSRVNGALRLSPLAHEEFKSCWISDGAWKMHPVRVSVKAAKADSLADQIEENLPREVANRATRLTRLLQDFFGYADSRGGALDVLRRLDELKDVDRTDPESLARIFRERLPDFPDDAIADKRLLIKFVADFYKVKGTSRGFSWLTRALHGSDSSLQYPEERLLRGSDAEWVREETIRVTDIATSLGERPEIAKKVFTVFRTVDPREFGVAADLMELGGNQVVGLESGATAIVEEVSQFLVGTTTVTELKISGRIGEFVADEILAATPLVGSNVVVRNLHCVVGTQLVGFGPLKLTSSLSPTAQDQYTFAPQTRGKVPTATWLKNSPVVIDGGWLVPAGTAQLKTSTPSGLLVVGTSEVVIGTVKSQKGYWRDSRSAGSDSWTRPIDGERFQIFAYDLVSEDENVLESSHVHEISHPGGMAKLTSLAEDAVVASAAVNRKSETRRLGESFDFVASGKSLSVPNVYEGERLLSPGETKTKSESSSAATKTTFSPQQRLDQVAPILLEYETEDNLVWPNPLDTILAVSNYISQITNAFDIEDPAINAIAADLVSVSLGMIDVESQCDVIQTFVSMGDQTNAQRLVGGLLNCALGTGAFPKTVTYPNGVLTKSAVSNLTSAKAYHCLLRYRTAFPGAANASAALSAATSCKSWLDSNSLSAGIYAPSAGEDAVETTAVMIHALLQKNLLTSNDADFLEASSRSTSLMGSFWSNSSGTFSGNCAGSVLAAAALKILDDPRANRALNNLSRFQTKTYGVVSYSKDDSSVANRAIDVPSAMLAAIAKSLHGQKQAAIVDVAFLDRFWSEFGQASRIVSPDPIVGTSKGTALFALALAPNGYLRGTPTQLRTSMNGDSTVTIDGSTHALFDVTGDGPIDVVILNYSVDTPKTEIRLSTPTRAETVVMSTRRVDVASGQSETETSTLEPSIFSSSVVVNGTPAGVPSMVVTALNAALVDYTKPRLYIKATATPENLRGCQTGCVWTQSGITAQVVASVNVQSDVWFILEFESVAQAQSFSPFTQVSRTFQ